MGKTKTKKTKAKQSEPKLEEEIIARNASNKGKAVAIDDHDRRTEQEEYKEEKEEEKQSEPSLEKEIITRNASNKGKAVAIDDHDRRTEQEEDKGYIIRGLPASKSQKIAIRGKRKKTQNPKAKITFPPLIPPLPEVVMNCIDDDIRNCSKPFEMQLTANDVAVVPEDTSRLTLPDTHVEKNISPLLRKHNDHNAEYLDGEGIEVDIFNWEGSVYRMKFKILPDIPPIYALTGRRWASFVNDHRLVEQDWVAVWMFRLVGKDKICFVIIPRGNLDGAIN